MNQNMAGELLPQHFILCLNSVEYTLYLTYLLKHVYIKSKGTVP